MDINFFDSLFEGDSAKGARLAMGLTGGDFWPCVAGCSLLYRGGNMDEIDFDDILAVADADSEQISPPAYISHANSSTYFYVVRRANNCGDQERTLAACARVTIDPNGNLAESEPNKIFEIKAEQTAGHKAKLTWYYSPIEQESLPVSFKVYYDNGTGQIDYENPVATVNYSGRRFYSCQTNTLSTGQYLFAIRAEDTDGTQNGSLAKIRIEITTENPEPINIISTQTL